MFDIHLRSVKDRLFDPLCQYVPESLTPTQITAIAQLLGLTSCYFASHRQITMSLLTWAVNRVLDCLDGAVARKRGTASDFGGFIDLLGDFVVYSILPVAIADGWDSSAGCYKAVAVLEATFHINNFILFYVAAIAEKGAIKELQGSKTKELTSIMMRPALIEGMESGVLFTLMLAFPQYIRLWSLSMAMLVSIGIVQRGRWVLLALG